MWWALTTPVGASACSEPVAEADPAGVIMTCARGVLLDSALHYGLGLAGGALIGGLVGLLLAGAIPRAGGRPRRARARSVATDAAPVSVLAGAGSSAAGERWITARYAGRCASCSRPVAPGDRVRHRPGRVSCERCCMTLAAR